MDDMDALECMKRNEKKKKKKKLKKRKRKNNISIKIDDAIKNRKIKAMTDFDFNECNSIKSIAIERNTTVDVPWLFLKAKC